MNNELFLIFVALVLGASFNWAFRRLPDEEWQIIAAVPKRKGTAGEWQGLNLTYYGFFMATSNALAAVMMLILLGSIGIPAAKIFILMIAIFAICWPSSRIIARIVEKKSYAFTVGGALFVGMLTTPWIIKLMNVALGGAFGPEVPVIPALAASAVAYAYAEGLGRLSCISFGCCYGKQVEQLPPLLRGIFESVNFVFAGATKKVAYEGNLEGVRVVPVQAMTAVIATVIALAGTYLYLKSYFVAALMVTMVLMQIWRVLSEALRADFRGNAGSLSIYQAMALFMIVYLVFIVTIFEAVALPANIVTGLNSLWNPVVLLLCQALWLAVFLVTGRSMVTGSTLTFFVHRDRI
jgi:hypothetical protein